MIPSDSSFSNIYFSDIADPNSDVFDPLLCIKNGVEFIIPKNVDKPTPKQFTTSSTGPR